MEVINNTPYVFLPFDCSPAPDSPALSLIVKGTFRLRPDEPAIAAGKNDQAQPAGDEMHMDDLGRSLRYSSDLVALKLKGEAFVTAVCHTPDGRPRASCDVGIKIGPIQKTLRVTGDRLWTRGTAGNPVIGTPTPFESMPLRWERAFGGLSFSANPLGRGAEPAPDDSGKVVHALPNIEYLDKRIADIKDLPPPAGVGPISPMWSPRVEKQGTRDQRWAMFRAPLPPKDFDPAFYNAAPLDQQLPEGFFRGDEAIVMTGLHKQLPVYRSSLPNKRLRLFLLVRQPKDEHGKVPEPRWVDVEMKLDTVHVDMEAERLVLVWRRPIKTKHRAHPEIEAAYITEEDLASEPLSADAHFKRFQELRGPKEPSTGAAMAAEVDAQMAEATKILKDAKVDPKVIAQVEGNKDPHAVFKILMDHAEEKIREINEMAAAFRARGGG